MKKNIIIFLVLAALVVLTPKFLSTQIETRYNHLLTEINTHPALSVQNIEHQAGWFNSNLKYELVFTPVVDGEYMSLEVNEQILHGPVVVDDGLHFALAKAKSRFRVNGLEMTSEDMASMNEHLKVTSLISYSGDMKSQFEMKAFDINEEGSQVSFAPAVGTFLLSAGDDAISGDLSWEGMSVQFDTGVVKVAGLSGDFDLNLISGSLFDGTGITVGTANMNLKSFEVQDGAMPPMVMENMKTTFTSGIQDKLMNMQMDYVIERFDIMGEPLTDTRMNILIDNLDQEGLAEINSLLMDMQTAVNEGREPEDETEALVKAFPELLKTDPVFRIDPLETTLIDGKVEADLTATANAAKINLNNPESIMQALLLQGNFSLPMMTLQRTGMKPFIDVYVQQGFMTINGDQVEGRFKWSEGALYLNDKPLPMGGL